MSKAQKQEARMNHKVEEPKPSRGAIRTRGHHTVNQDIEHSDPKWVRVLSGSGVDTGAIQNKKTSTIIQRNKSGGGWHTVSPSTIIETPAQIAAKEARARETAEYIPDAPAVTAPVDTPQA